MYLRLWCIASKLGFNVVGGILARGIEIAKMINARRLGISFERLRGRMQKCERRVSVRRHEWNVIHVNFLKQDACKRILFAPELPEGRGDKP